MPTTASPTPLPPAPLAPYAVFYGPHRRKAATAAAAGAVLLGVILAAVPGSAAARTVRPTTPGSSAFTAAGHGLDTRADLVQRGEPTAYPLPGGPGSARDAVGTTSRLTPHAPPAPAPPPAPHWFAPVPGARISNPYGEPNPEYAAGYHTGVDFAVDQGTPVLAVGDATVVSAGWAGSYGNQIVLLLEDGRYAQYAHLSELAIGPGDTVTAGQRIGASGSTGNSTGPHLHFEIRTSNSYGAVTDPIGYLSGHGATNF
ncbi:murein DD-endopeptidase MepM/ murein hydrolase activator NlpD [Kitasatospora sp. MAP12-15]|uniref:M23 family metallopeptidase n=1 Tax=unclassified Kitasatospora TaxID=2633591 RepID=UPI002472FB3B|nr:M23 family metallopeptidase [Kitasatospora sp. MAP12-44]MDH6111210.1 murein DD-endopeptidase MepM/ murein hydrolase activator NlpD [Kitasatospora sp. MAP12-44]